MRVYLDNGATTKVDDIVFNNMKKYMLEEYGNASSLHTFGQVAQDALEKSRIQIANKINAEPSEIIFTSGGTESDNLAILGISKALSGKHIITSKIEHPAILKTCKYLENIGYSITYLNVDSEGFVDLDQLKNSFKPDTILVSIIHANNEIGTIQNIEEISKICKNNNVLFHTDAVQSFTKIPIDVKKIGIDLMSISAHKIHGPKGVGALYVRKGVNLKPINYGGPHEFGKRAGTENVSSIVGFATSSNLITENDIFHMKKLQEYFILEVINKIPDVKLNGPKDYNKRICSNVNFAFKGCEGEAILLYLDSEGISVSTGSACASKSLNPSYVLSAIKLDMYYLQGAIRFTFSKYTTKDEIDYTINKLVEVISKVRKISNVV